MRSPDDVLNLPDLVMVLCAASVRSGDVLELDRLAEMPPAQRVVHATQVLSRSATMDPRIAKVLNDTHAAPIMRIEFTNRRNHRP